MTSIIKIKYADNVGQTDVINNVGETFSEPSAADNKEFMVNINCNIGLILDYIREVAHFEETAEFDLWEESSSRLMNISSKETHKSGLEFFLPNHTYFIITVKRDSKGKIMNYIPMINGRQSRALSEIITKIKRITKKNSVTKLSSTKLNEKGGRKKSQEKLN